MEHDKTKCVACGITQAELDAQDLPFESKINVRELRAGRLIILCPWCATDLRGQFDDEFWEGSRGKQFQRMRNVLGKVQKLVRNEAW